MSGRRDPPSNKIGEFHIIYIYIYIAVNNHTDDLSRIRAKESSIQIL